MRRIARRYWPALGLLALAVAMAAADAAPASADAAPAGVPPFVAAAERGGPPPPDPARQPEAWLIAHVDVEATGLVPGWHEMIDIGIVLTELDGSVRDSYFTRIQPRHPERLSPGAFAVNAFEPERWKRLGALEPAAAVREIVAFHGRAAAGRHVLLAAYNSQFDTAFVDHLLRAEGRSWRELYHYFVLDVPSMAWALGLRELVNGRVAARLGVPDEPRVAEEHTGVTGAMLNARIYQALVRRARELGVEPAAAAGIAK
jgi:DNA polymerase III epsilon subunit-like protein